MMLQPVKFVPYLKSVIWGGENIAPYKGIDTDQRQIGESWEISSVPGHVSVVADGPYRGMTLTELIAQFGASLVGKANYEKYGTTFPLLVKLIDAADNLSVQVHPDDRLAMERHNSLGKTEMWNIIAAAGDAKIYAGLCRQITPDEYQRRVADNTIMEVIAEHDSAPGDVFFLPAGRIHAIGAGNLLAEIQQTSDVTYRIYDYDRRDKDGNPRQLHTAQAREAIDYTVYPEYKSIPTDNTLVDCPYFAVDRLAVDGNDVPLPHRRDSFTIVMCISGETVITYPTTDGDGKPCSRSCRARQGETLLFPASMSGLTATGHAILLSVQA